MVKKVKNAVTYREGDTVVVKTKKWSGEVTYAVGLVTNVRLVTQQTKQRTYDIRTEAGSGLIMTTVDEKKSTQTISSALTTALIESGHKNNMFIHRKHGHTRANYSKDTKLKYDGQSSEKGSSLLLGHFEKYNNFVFPCQGPRSF